MTRPASPPPATAVAPAPTRPGAGSSASRRPHEPDQRGQRRQAADQITTPVTAIAASNAPSATACHARAGMATQAPGTTAQTSPAMSTVPHLSQPAGRLTDAAAARRACAGPHRPPLATPSRSRHAGCPSSRVSWIRPRSPYRFRHARGYQEQARGLHAGFQPEPEQARAGHPPRRQRLAQRCRPGHAGPAAPVVLAPRPDRPRSRHAADRAVRALPGPAHSASPRCLCQRMPLFWPVSLADGLRRPVRPAQPARRQPSGWARLLRDHEHSRRPTPPARLITASLLPGAYPSGVGGDFRLCPARAPTPR